MPILPPDETAPDLTDQDYAQVLSEVVPSTLEDASVSPQSRAQLLDLAGVPQGRINRAAYAWEEVSPGLKLHTLFADPAKNVKKCLVWGTPGTSSPRHGHSGDELILVLEGRLKDERGTYGPGDICRSSAGDVHEEQVVGDVDCVCYVVYYGDLIPV